VYLWRSYEHDPTGRSAAKLLTKDEARRIAANITSRRTIQPLVDER
jgi:hypothetical protein